MKELWDVILFALFPAAGNFLGGAAVEVIAPTKKLLNRALHAAAGLMLAVVAIAVMPEALKHVPPWLIALMFLVGGCSYLLVNILISCLLQDKVQSKAWMVYAAVVADLVGDGLLIGTGAAVSDRLALVLALGQVMADVPEGFAVVANFRDKGKTRTERLMISASFALPVIAAAVAAYFLLKGQSMLVKSSGLVFVSGLFCLAAVEDMVSEAHEVEEDTHWSSLSFLAGFSLFVLVYGYFGG